MPLCKKKLILHNFETMMHFKKKKQKQIFNDAGFRSQSSHTHTYGQCMHIKNECAVLHLVLMEQSWRSHQGKQTFVPLFRGKPPDSSP